VLDGVINVFGDQSAAGTALLNSAALSGNIQNAKGTSKGADFKMSREVGDWLNTGHQAGLAIGAQYEHQEFRSAANTEFAAKGDRLDRYRSEHPERRFAQRVGLLQELNVPVLKNLDVTAAVRYDKYSDFGHTANPKLGFTFRPAGSAAARFVLEGLPRAIAV
jgi:iron complex outermembrane receptor protein